MPVAPSKSFLRHSSKRLLVTSNCGLTSNRLQQNFFHRHSIEGGPISNTLKDQKVRSVERVKHDELLPPGTQVSRNSLLYWEVHSLAVIRGSYPRWWKALGLYKGCSLFVPVATC